ncbi:MAG: TRAP transporter small permease subunit [Gammaproteobacteria bacterium]
MQQDLIHKFARAANGLNDRIGRAVSWLTLAMVVVTVLVVVLRYGFDTGWIWMQESVTWMYSLVFMLGASYTFAHDGHVRVDIFYREAGSRRQALVDLAGIVFLLLPICMFILITSWDFVVDSWRVREASREAGGLPGVFLLKSIMPVMAVLLILQGFAIAVAKLDVLSSKTTSSSDDQS